jgi:hypothetical protein
VRRQLRQQPYRLRQSLRPVVGERCRFQRSLLPNQDIDRTPTPRSPI